MTYHNKFVCVIKVNGKVLRERSGQVFIPFGAEYSVFLKNLEGRRRMAKVSIDGTDATEGIWLIVPANGSIELERYIKNGNMDRGNRFKFIERSADVEAHRGIGSDDGLVRVEYRTEQAVVDAPRVRYYDKWIPTQPPIWPTHPDHSANFVGTVQSAEATCNVESSMSNSMDSLAGITVPGSESGQHFVHSDWFPTESQSEVIVLSLVGQLDGKQVAVPVTVERKPQCVTCGTVNPSMASFCSRCGTALQII